MKNFLYRFVHFVVTDRLACLLLALVLAAGVSVAMFMQPVVLVVAAGQADQDEKSGAITDRYAGQGAIQRSLGTVVDQ